MSRRRVAIAVVPRLLGDALSRVLAREGRDIVVVQTERVIDLEALTDEERHFDVALVSETLPESFEADVVIRLPDTPSVGLARVGGKPVPITGVDDLVALVEGATIDRGTIDGGTADGDGLDGPTTTGGPTAGGLSAI